MALRSLNVDIGFNVNQGPLKKANDSTEEFKENIEGSGSSLDDLGAQAESTGDTMTDEFNNSSDILEDLGSQAGDTGDDVSSAMDNAGESAEELGFRTQDTGDMIVGATDNASDGFGNLTDLAVDSSDSISDAGSTAADGIDQIGSSAGSAASDVSDATATTSDELSDVGTQAGDAGGKMKQIGTKSQKWIKGIAVGAVIALGGAFTAMSADATSSMASVEDSMKTFQVKTGESTAAAEEFSDIIKDMHSVNTDSYSEIGDAATIVSQRYDEQGDSLKNLTQDFMDYVKVTDQGEDSIISMSRIQKQFGVDVDDTSDMLDKFMVVSQKTGAPVEDLQRNIEQMGPSLQTAGFSLDETIGLMGLFEKSGVDSQRAMRGMRSAMNQIDNPEELRDTVYDMIDMKNESKRTEKAIDIFGGTAGPQMARALSEGKGAYEGLLDTIGNSEGTVSEASNTFDEQLGEQFTLLMRDVIDPLRESIGTELVDAFSSFMDWIEGNMPTIKAVTEPVFEGIGKSIGFVADHFDILGPAITAALIVVGVPAFYALATAAGSAAIAVLGVTWPILAIGAAIGIVVGAFVWAWQNWDQITDWMGTAVDWLKDKFHAGLNIIKDFFVNIWTSVKEFGIELWTSFSSTVIGIWQGFVDGIVNFVSMIGTGIKTGFNATKNFAVGLWQGFKSTISSIWSGLVSGITGFVSSISDGIRSGFNAVKDFGVSMWTGFKDGILNIWSGLTSGIKGFVNSIIGAVNSMIGGINSVNIDIPGWVSKIPGVPDGMDSIGFNIPKIPKLAEGGMVTDATMSVVGEGADNEAVIPLNRKVFSSLGQGIVNELDDDDDSEYSDYDNYDVTNEQNNHTITFGDIKIVVETNGESDGKQTGEDIGKGFEDYLENHYGSLIRRVINRQEG